METSRANVLIHRSDGQTFAMDDKPIGLLELKGACHGGVHREKRRGRRRHCDGQPRGGKGDHHPGQIARGHQKRHSARPGGGVF